MQDATKAYEKSGEIFAQFTGKTLEGLALWADTNQRVLREMVNLSTVTTKEAARLCAELHSSAVEAIRESQTEWLKRQSAELPKDPVLWYQKGLAESIDGAQNAVRYVEASGRAVTRTTQQIQASAERSGKEIQDAYSTLATRMQQVCAGAPDA